MIEALEVEGILHHGRAVAGFREIDGKDLADGGGGAVGHHDDAVAEEDDLIDIVGDEDCSDFFTIQDIEDDILKLHAGEGVEATERLVEEEDFWLEGDGTGDADALLHAAGHFAGIFVHGILEADGGEGVFDDLFPLLLGGVG